MPWTLLPRQFSHVPHVTATRTFVELVALTWSRPQKEQAALQEKSPSPFGPKYDAVM